MEKEYIKNTKKELLEIKASLQGEKNLRLANGFATAANIALLPFAIRDSFSYNTTSGFFVASFVVMCASINGIFVYKDQKYINQAITNFKNLKDEYNSQKKLTNKMNH
jgi:hypothetical protein